MSTFGRLRLDVENCLNELVVFGVHERIAGTPPRFAAARPDDEDTAMLLDTFLERRAGHQHRRPGAVRPALPRNDRAATRRC
jgi:hypothetical protein